MADNRAGSMDRIVALCKRRGFIFQSSEIYGGINGFWDYGPLGVELKRNLKDAWWRDIVHSREDVVGLDSSIIMHPRVWQSSGHADLFSDKMVDCRTCGARFRVDQLDSSPCQRKPKQMAGQGPECDLTEPRDFNLMFQTWVGAIRDDENMVSLRPETAQGIFVNFRNVCDSTRMKVPFGIAQVGKSFRNEITPRHFIFRSREFEQMELEFFCHPSEALEWYEYWCNERLQWYIDLGLPAERLQMRAHDPDELSHYSLGTSDIEYAYPFLEEGQFGELEGIAHRRDFDLRSHIEGKLISEDGELVLEMTEDGKPKYKGSGKDLTYFDQERRERFVPNVIEPSAGADRALLAFICEAYTMDESRPSPEILRLHPRLAPVKAAFLPLVNKDGLPEIAQPLYQAVKKRWLVQYDSGGSIGKRYARMDEAGTPYCFTIDGQTKEDGTVTVRDRDTGHQDRIAKDRVIEFLEDKLDC